MHVFVCMSMYGKEVKIARLVSAGVLICYFAGKEDGFN